MNVLLLHLLFLDYPLILHFKAGLHFAPENTNFMKSEALFLRFGISKNVKQTINRKLKSDLKMEKRKEQIIKL